MTLLERKAKSFHTKYYFVESEEQVILTEAEENVGWSISNNELNGLMHVLKKEAEFTYPLNDLIKVKANKTFFNPVMFTYVAANIQFCKAGHVFREERRDTLVIQPLLMCLFTSKCYTCLLYTSRCV